ncbi:3-epi-6-deoxocathasterone 23-monooxygenase CYP90C1 [Nicotiana sylvestris]|uniref:22alpha-hydroxysteroid 23-monooxygenase n=1 Tax=Nicotiana sylvestris TaxID=4096 RepID=A0A1U7V4X1_NICSY|nr:PREDICTED: 3-epi-6-deoxocathasterone 23-monooxygenase [Nicotiana sylvestris]
MKGESGGSLVWIGITTVVAVGLFIYKMRKGQKEKKDTNRGVPRGNSGWPLLGETLEFIASGYTSRPVSFMEKRKSLYGKVFKTHILGKGIIVSTDAEVNKVVLQNNGDVFVPCYPKSITELFGKNSILQMNGPVHRRVHGLIGSFLKSAQLKARITRDIEASVRHFLSTWLEKQHCVYVQDEAKKIAFEVLVKLILSVGPGEELNLLKKEFEEFTKGLICLPIKLPGTTLYKSLKAKERLSRMVGKMVEDRKLRMETREEKALPNDAIDVLLGYADGAKQPLPPSDFISGNLIEMMIPGEETVPTAMTLAVKFLSDNPVALARLVEENMELKRQKISSSEDYSWTDYMSLPFTQNVISETLRLANIINAVWRKALKDVKIKGHLIPKGWCALASFTSVHMDEENYENPYNFDPCRWEKVGIAVTSSTFTPFGGGQRLCPGLELSRLEISIFLHHLVTTYRWVAEKDEIVYFPTVKMKSKLPINIMPFEQKPLIQTKQN